MCQDIKYSVFVDRYVGTSNKRIGKYVIPCMNFEKYGIFVNLDENHDGLIHISEITS